MTTEPQADVPVTVAGRLSTYLRGGGIFVPVVTALFAFIVGGIVVLAAGGNPIDTYRAIFEGSSFADFAFHPVLTGSPDPRTIEGLARAVEAGTPTLKVFTTDVTSAPCPTNSRARGSSTIPVRGFFAAFPGSSTNSEHP